MQAESFNQQFVVHKLFGGALECALPARFGDISNVREVPDHQEVFADVDTDQSIIFELLGLEDVEDSQAAAHFFKDLAAANDAENACQILHVEPLGKAEIPNFDDKVSKSVLVGQQQIAKFNEHAKNLVTVYLGNIRLRDVRTDVLVTFNDPIMISPASSSMQSVVSTDQSTSTPTIFKAILQSLVVKDWTVFGA